MAEQETLDGAARAEAEGGVEGASGKTAGNDNGKTGQEVGLAAASAQAALYAALAAAQAEFPPIHRSRTVRVKTTTGGTYEFSYAPLDAIFAALRPPLAANGLAITQLLDATGEHFLLRTQLLHAGGGVLESTWPMSAHGKPQEFGSALTYLRRYALTALLGVASEEDDDGNAAEGHTATAQGKAAGGAESASKAKGGATRGNASDAQVKMVNGLIREMVERGIGDDETLRASVHTQYGVEHIPELTGGRDGQASELIGRLQKALCNSYLEEFSREESEALVLEHGGTNGLLSNVPANQLSDLLKALKAAAA